MFTVTVDEMDKKIELVKESFETKKEANKFKRQFMKLNEMVNHGGYFVNYSARIELSTNY